MTKDNKETEEKNIMSKDPELKKEKGEAVISGSIAYEELLKQKSAVIKELKTGLEIDGFRKGQVPDDMVEKHIGQIALLQEMAEKVLQNEYPELIRHFQIYPIGSPEVSITKLAPDNPLEYIIKVALIPEVKLPDYKKIAGAENKKNNPRTKEVKVEDSEIDQVFERLKQSKSKENNDEKFEINDQTVKTLGEYSSVEELRKSIKEGIGKEKQIQEIEKHRISIIEKIMEKTEMEIPELIISEELAKMIDRLKHDVSHAGLSFEDYLSQIKKTEESLKTEWRPQAENRAKMQLTLNAIVQKENIDPDNAVVEEQTKTLMEHYPKANPEQIRIFVISQLANEEVLKSLESEGVDEKKANK